MQYKDVIFDNFDDLENVFLGDSLYINIFKCPYVNLNFYALIVHI